MTSASLGGGGNTFLKTKNSNRLRRGRVPSVKKRWSPVLRQGQDRAPACRRAFGSHAKGKGSSGNAERAQRCNAASSLSGGKNHTHPAAKVLANPSSKSQSSFVTELAAARPSTHDCNMGLVLTYRASG